MALASLENISNSEMDYQKGLLGWGPRLKNVLYCELVFTQGAPLSNDTGYAMIPDLNLTYLNINLSIGWGEDCLECQTLCQIASDN